MSAHPDRAAGLAPAAAGRRRPCGLSSDGLSREYINRKHTTPVCLIVCADLLWCAVSDFFGVAACGKCFCAVAVVVPNDHVRHFLPFPGCHPILSDISALPSSGRVGQFPATAQGPFRLISFGGPTPLSAVQPCFGFSIRRAHGFPVHLFQPPHRNWQLHSKRQYPAGTFRA